MTSSNKAVPAVDVDVAVLGAGLAGCAAALSLAHQGKRVAVVSDGLGATRMWSGAIDVADDMASAVPSPAYDPWQRGSLVVDAIDAVSRNQPQHPYAWCNVAPMQALQQFCSAWPELQLTTRQDGGNHLLVTQAGTVKRSAAVLASQHFDLADVADGAVVAVAAWRDLAGFDAEPVVQMLEFLGAFSQRRIRFVPVLVPPVTEVHDDAAAMGRAMEKRGIEAHATALREAVRSVRATAVLVPPMMSESLMPDVSSWQRIVGVPVREMLAMPGAPIGLRMERAWRDACGRVGILVRQGRVQQVEVRDPVQQTIVLEGGTTVRSRALVLASGRFFGGGIVRDHRAHEALLQLPLYVDGVPFADQYIGTLTGDHVDADHAVFRAGVLVNTSLQPMLSPERVAHARVFAAGSVVGGYDLTRGGAAGGVTLQLATAAAHHAAASLGSG
jgi:glycerol-3-phosphate dehydrogenase subunit B